MGNIKQEDGERRLKSRSRTPQESRQSPQVKSRSSTPSSNKPPKLSRKASQPTREPPLFGHLPDFTDGATQTFQVIPDCLYGSKHLGSTDNDALDCDCRDEWLNGENMACGEDSDCINRATKMECGGGGGNCGDGCQNQRFQRKEYANVSVIKTEKKGFGLRIDSELQANDFIFEYIGEVINEPTFRRRMVQYDQEGIKHFYFMSLNKNEFVDATKKGNLGRFCNHSCSPNCYVDKWVVGDKLRMGIFALRKVRAGEELVFNYNVDRYGADPQPCYCDEPNCVGFIGGKTQTERATKLPAATVEALGIDGYDGWDTTVAKRPRKKRVEEDDEDYVNSIQPRGLDEEGARKVMATLMQCKEKWIAVKLLERIQRCDEERVILSVMRMHAYQILRSVLTSFNEDEHVILQVLLILDKFPRLTRNKIRDSNIEAAIEPLKASVHSEVAEKASKLLDDWSKLQVAFRIGRRKVEHVEPDQNATETRQGNRTEDTLAAQKAAPLSINAPKGPRSMAPQRQFPLHQRPRPRPFQGPLPVGWSSARDASGNTYFYDKQGTTTWTRPTQPAAEPGPNRAAQEKAAIQSIIDRVTKEGSTPKPIVAQTARASPAISEESKRQAKWRSLPIEKQMKIYENTIFPAVKYIIDKYRQKLPKDELKRLGKEVTRNLVASDYKKNRVQDPSIPLTEKGTHQVKKAVTQYMDRAVAKYGSFRDGMTDNKVSQGSQPNHSQATDSPMLDRNHEPTRDGEDMVMSDVGTPASAEKKRKREDEMPDSLSATPSDDRDNKRSRENGYVDPSPPPPPPPPGGIDDAIAEEQRQLREQEEALMRENEEAQRLDDEANYNGSATNGSGHA